MLGAGASAIALLKVSSCQPGAAAVPAGAAAFATAAAAARAVQQWTTQLITRSQHNGRELDCMAEQLASGFCGDRTGPHSGATGARKHKFRCSMPTLVSECSASSTHTNLGHSSSADSEKTPFHCSKPGTQTNQYSKECTSFSGPETKSPKLSRLPTAQHPCVRPPLQCLQFVVDIYTSPWWVASQAESFWSHVGLAENAALISC